MLFPTIEFSLFLLFSLSIWIFIPQNKLRLIALITFNFFFYSFLNPVLILYLIGWTFVIWISGKFLKLRYLIIGLSILQLIFWKAVDAKFIHFSSLITPLGVSFFTFQGLTYLFARMRLPKNKKEEHIEQYWNFFKLFAFIGFFPTVLSGPILRAKYWEEQYNNPTPLTQKTFNYALTCIALGSFYKLCLSSIFHDYVSLAFSNPTEDTGSNLLIGLYAYTFEIYHDFAGYSLMAIGVALLYGFKLQDNFKQPYLATNIRDFWQRWHISFSTWLRDYFYISMGGSRVGFYRHLLNSMIVMFVCGAWHGLTGNYLVWGIMHGIAICIYHIVKDKITLPHWLGWLITFHYVAIAWIFFRSPDTITGIHYLQSLFTNQSWSDLFTLKSLAIFSLFVFCLIMQKIEPWILQEKREFKSLIFNPYLTYVFWSFIFISILIVSPSGMPPFIYFSY